MAFESARWPNAATIGKLIDRGQGRFRCERCGSRETTARPHFEEVWPLL